MSSSSHSINTHCQHVLRVDAISIILILRRCHDHPGDAGRHLLSFASITSILIMSNFSIVISIIRLQPVPRHSQSSQAPPPPPPLPSPLHRLHHRPPAISAFARMMRDHTRLLVCKLIEIAKCMRDWEESTAESILLGTDRCSGAASSSTFWRSFFRVVFASLLAFSCSHAFNIQQCCNRYGHTVYTVYCSRPGQLLVL